MYSLKRLPAAITGWLHRDHGGTGRTALGIAAVLTVSLAAAAEASPPPFQESSGEYYYYSSGERKPLILSEEEIVVRFREGVDPDRALMRDPFLSVDREGAPDGRFRLNTLDLAVPGTGSVMSAIADLNAREDVEFAAPVFFADRYKSLLTDEICVKFRPDLTDAEISQISETYGIEILREHAWAENSFTVLITDRSPADALTLANTLYEDDRVVHAHPNFVTLSENCLTPDDTYYSDSWNLNNTEQRGGTAGADIEMPEGWDLATGSVSIVVAVLDGHGVDTSHPDFSGKTVQGYDALDIDNDPSPGLHCEGHGTCCAGVACAATDNALGVSGIGWHVKLMGVRIGSDLDCDGGFYSTPDIMADAISTAVSRGADVLSNSYGTTDTDTFHDAIIDATTNGRGGLGSVFCGATGNYDVRNVLYPARYDEAIAVGATNWCDERKREENDDCNNEEWWWGSNFGPSVDVVAPGMAIWTTDNPDTGGYNVGDTAEGDAAGDYYMWFNGTSAACPHVAGLAGLVLSVDNTLTADEVQTHIQNGADDEVGLAAEDVAGWDEFMGHGRINAYETLMLVAEPNLIPWQHTGWDDKIVPRNTGDAGNFDVPLPDSLYGNSPSYLNWCEHNASPAGCPPHSDRTYLDNVHVSGASWSRMAPYAIGVAINFGPVTVKGGLHTLRTDLDWDDQVDESYETDNTYTQQFAWTPYILADRTTIYRNGLPDKGSLTYPNSDGFQASYTWMTAVAMAPGHPDDDYDLRLHPEYTSPMASFRGYQDNSSAGAGLTDIIVANWFGGGDGTEDIGAFRFNTSGPNSGLFIENTDLDFAFVDTGTHGPYTLGVTRLVDLYTLYVTTADYFTIEIEVTSGDADIVLGLFDYNAPYMDRYETLRYSNGGGGGEGEMVNAPLIADEYYPVAVFKNGTPDIGEEVTYLVHIYETPPNLQPYAPAGWDYPLTPRDAGGALCDNVVLTDSLTGNSSATWLNGSWWNAGPDSCGSNRTYLIVDGDPFAYSEIAELAPGAWTCGVNWGPYSFKGGRHTLTESVDHLDWVLESDEDDNVWDKQFAWTPLVLASDSPMSQPGPPEPGLSTYDNCNGYQLTGTWWNVIGMIPQDASDDYDMRLHMQYSGSFDGFDYAYELSPYPAGYGDFVIFNGNHSSIGYGATFDASVFVSNAPAGGNCYIEAETSSGSYSAPVDIAGQSLNAYEILDVFEIYFSATGNYTVELVPHSGSANVGITMYDYLGNYMDKSEAMPGAFSNTGGGGEPEMFTVEIDTAGFYGLVAWKGNSWDLPETMDYTLRIYSTLTNLTYSTPAGWSYPMTPRSTGDATQYYAPVTATLPGNAIGTYLNISWWNEGPATAVAHETHGYLDGYVIEGLRRVAPLSPEDSLFAINLGPHHARGGRHTLSLGVDALDEVLESDEGDNSWSRQFVWSPLELTPGTPVTRIPPPERGAGAIPNCDGYYFPNPSTYTSVIGMCPRTGYDYDLYLYDDYSGSESGFSVLLATSMMGTDETEFVGVRYNLTNEGQYPAAVRPAPVKGDGGSRDETMTGEFVVHAVRSLGNVLHDHTLPAEEARTLGPDEIVMVFDVELATTTYDFDLLNDAGNADLAFAIMPIGSSHYGRGDAALEVNSAGAGGDEHRSVTVAVAGWFEVVVFKTGADEVWKTSDFRFRVGEQGTAGIPELGPDIPTDVVMRQNSPNPFGEFTSVAYGIPGSGSAVRLRVYDTSGRLVATLVDGFKQPGYHTATWNGRTDAGKAAASGVYFYRLEAGGHTLTKQMLLLK